jgi:hypothetical protein
MIAAAVLAVVLAAGFLAGVIVWAARSRDGKHAAPSRRPLTAEDAATVTWLQGLRRRPEPRGTVHPLVTWQWGVLTARAAALGHLITHARTDDPYTRWPWLKPGEGYSDATGEFTRINGDGA